MEEFRLGGVESGLVILCHMVSLIAIFSQGKRGTPKETHEGEKHPEIGHEFSCFDVTFFG